MGCSKCIDNCPKNAIEINTKIEIRENCNGCNLCTAVCPTGVFMPSPLRINMLLKTMEENSALLSCSKNKDQIIKSEIYCLSGLSKNLLLLLAILNPKSPVFLDCTHCAECVLPIEVLEENVRRANEFLEVFSPRRRLMIIKNENEFIKTDDDQMYSRQEVFNLWKDKTFELIKNGLYSTLELFFQDQDKGFQKNYEDLPLEHAMLTGIMKENRIFPEKMRYCEGSPWGNHVITDCCNGCGQCLTACPTGALDGTYEKNIFKIVFRPERCLNCIVCRQACPKGAIKEADEFSVRDILENGQKVLWQQELSTCERCKEPFLRLTDDDRCSECLKIEEMKEEIFGSKNFMKTISKV